MNDLYDFLEPINKAQINDDEGYNDGQLANFISIYETNLPEISDAAIVFIGVPEVRGSGNKNVSRSITLFDIYFTYDRTIKTELENMGVRTSLLPFGFDKDAFDYRELNEDEEILKLKNNLISERDYQKIQNKFENNFVSSNSSIEGIANSLARYYMLYGDVNLINNEIDIYRSITREEIKTVANKYLNADQRLILEYLPESDKE